MQSEALDRDPSWHAYSRAPISAAEPARPAFSNGKKKGERAGSEKNMEYSVLLMRRM